MAVHEQWCADKVGQKFFAIKQYLGIQLRLQWNIDTTEGQGTEALPTKPSCSYNSISNIDNTKSDLYLFVNSSYLQHCEFSLMLSFSSP